MSYLAPEFGKYMYTLVVEKDALAPEMQNTHNFVADPRLEGPILHDASVDGREKARMVKELRLGCVRA